MSFKTRLKSDFEEHKRLVETEEEKDRLERERVERLSEAKLLKVEKYYQKFIIQALREVSEEMGGDGPNPDGSLPWRGGQKWTWDPNFTKSEQIATIEASVVWDKVFKSSKRGSGDVVKAGLKIKVNSDGSAFCSDYNGSNSIRVDLKSRNCREELSDACFEVVKKINEENRYRYVPGRSTPTIPLYVRQERTEKIRQAYVLPLFRQLAQRYGVSMSQDPYVGYKLFSGEYTSGVPVRPGYTDGTLIIQILSWVGSEPTIAVAVSIHPSENSVSTGGKSFDVTTQDGVNALWKYAFEYAATRPTVSFSTPVEEHDWGGM